MSDLELLLTLLLLSIGVIILLANVINLTKKLEKLEKQHQKHHQWLTIFSNDIGILQDDLNKLKEETK